MAEHYKLGDGRILLHHDIQDCEPPCVFHSPIRDVKYDWPLIWRADRQLVERVCPCGIGHPATEQVERVRQQKGDGAASSMSVHGCCGACFGIPCVPAPAAAAEAEAEAQA